jgi:hypothetical protein
MSLYFLSKYLLLEELLSYTQNHLVTYWDLVRVFPFFLDASCKVLIIMYICRNLVISSTMLGLPCISTWLLPNCYLWNLSKIDSFLDEICVTLTLLLCLPWAHLIQDLGTKNGHSGNITKHSSKSLNIITFVVFLCYHFWHQIHGVINNNQLSNTNRVSYNSILTPVILSRLRTMSGN